MASKYFIRISFVTVYMFVFMYSGKKMNWAVTQLQTKLHSKSIRNRVSLSNPGAQTKLAPPKMLVSRSRAIFSNAAHECIT